MLAISAGSVFIKDVKSLLDKQATAITKWLIVPEMESLLPDAARRSFSLMNVSGETDAEITIFLEFSAMILSLKHIQILPEDAAIIKK